jgi:LPXTG-site transpeptidase (sortase) family protein
MHISILGPKAKINNHLSMRLLLLSITILASAGIYLAVLIFSPYTAYVYGGRVSVNPVIEEKTTRANSLIVPKINLDIEYRNGGDEVLNEYVWHRYPERGDPVNGGNMILSAHRFELGWSPGETRRKSPFYNINKLNLGDEVLVYYEGNTYKYEVIELKTVTPTSIEIEAPSDEHILTIYSCTFGGEKDGRDVIVARPTRI